LESSKKNEEGIARIHRQVGRRGEEKEEKGEKGVARKEEKKVTKKRQRVIE
jgi:hypothetical protein